MNFRLLVILILIQCASLGAQDEAQKNVNDANQNSWNIKFRYLPTPYISFIGLGIERKVSSKLSIVWCINSTTYNGRRFEGTPSIILSAKPEIRYNISGHINNGFFVSKFVEIGQSIYTNEKELESNDYTYNKGGLLCGVGMLVGRNISLGKKLHIDMYLGPKHRWKNETTVTVVDQIESESSKITSYWGLRIGLNINFGIN